jgi:hypothetical protein
MNELWNRPVLPLSATPFEHVLADDFLPDDLFARLAASFPDCPVASGPTGFTIHPGDASFDALMAENELWHAFWQSCDSQAFTDFILRQFSDVFAREATADLGHARHVLYRESRADKESPQIARVEHAADRLWVRFDLMQGRVGYKRNVHLDHRRRAATMLIYFTDAEQTGADGGDLILHHTDGTVVSKVVPKANRLVMFPCHNRSWHSVSTIVSQRQPRNFLQVTLSSSVDLWHPLPKGPAARLRSFVRGLVGAGA